MSTTISKKDTEDIAISIVERIGGFMDSRQKNKGPVPYARELVSLVQEELNEWISDCESEDDEYRMHLNDK